MTDTVKHTPGPWYLGSMNDCLFVIDQPPRPSNDDINPGHHVNVLAKLDYSVASANARLISSAPDLLHALLCLVEWVEDHAVKPNEIPEIIGSRAAIAKANGR